MAPPILTTEEVQEYIRDREDLNKLLDGPEFSATTIRIAMDLAVGTYNMIPPSTLLDSGNFPNKALLMEGTLAKLLRGQAALKARNNMQYSDGGLQIPVEEQFPLYMQLAEMYEQSFMSNAKNLKGHLNLESAWGAVRSEYSQMPEW